MRYFLVFFSGLFIGAAGFYFFSKMEFQNFMPEDGAAQAGKLFKLVDLPFNQPEALKGWREYVFNKKSQYVIGPGPHGETVLHASSDAAFSALFKVVNIPLKIHPILKWQWRAATFPSGKKHPGFEAEGENDFAIRICAIFADNNPLATEIVQYVWDDYYPEGTHAASPYAKNVRMIVVESGPAPSEKTWVLEKRDVLKDYKMLFGEMAHKKLRAVAIMTNADDTQTRAEAYLKRIWIETSDKKTGQKRHRSITKTVREIIFPVDALRRVIPFAKKKRSLPAQGSSGNDEKTDGEAVS